MYLALPTADWINIGSGGVLKIMIVYTCFVSVSWWPTMPVQF